METKEIQAILQKQRAYFQSGVTLPVEKRIESLQRLKNTILANQDKIEEALRKDLGKSNTESYMCEVGLALSELTYMIRHTRKFAREKRVRTPCILQLYQAFSLWSRTDYVAMELSVYVDNRSISGCDCRR